MRFLISFSLLVVISNQAFGQIPQFKNGMRPIDPLDKINAILQEPVYGYPSRRETIPSVEGLGLVGELNISRETLEKIQEQYDLYIERLDEILKRQKITGTTDAILKEYSENDFQLAKLLGELNLDNKRLTQECYARFWGTNGLRYCLSLNWMQADLGITEDEMAAISTSLDKLQADMETELLASSKSGWDNKNRHTIRLNYEPKMFEMLSKDAKKKAIDVFGERIIALFAKHKKNTP